MRDRRFVAVDNISQHFKDNNLRIEKVNIYGMPEELQNEVYEALSKFDFIRFTKATPGADLEFYHNTLDKIKALEVLLERLGIGFDEAFAAGDSMIAGFIKHYLDTESFAESLKFAVACGSATAFSNWIAEKETIYSVYENM